MLLYFNMNDFSYNTVKELDDQIGTPFYLMYPGVYQKNLESFLSAFKSRYDRVIAGYSFKTNYVPALCLKAKECGCYAEVVSQMEYDLAIRLGFNNIIFNGPIKKREVLCRAIERNSIINLDSEYEVDYIISYLKENPKKTIKVGLRINIMLTDNDGHSTIQCGLKSGRFGFTIDRVGHVINRLKAAGIIINSLHGHTSSSNRVPVNYKVISEQLLRICSSYNLNDLKYFDIGGGFFGAAPEGFDTSNKPSYADYANAILDTVLKDNWFKMIKPYIIIEPGASVVSNVFDYITKVYQTKDIGLIHYASVDGSVFDVKPTMHQYNMPFEIISKDINNDKRRYNVVGSTCMEKDVILNDVEMPVVHYGDYVLIKGVGSYTISMTPIFINYLSPIIAVEEMNYSKVRNRQSIEDVISIYEILQ